MCDLLYLLEWSQYESEPNTLFCFQDNFRLQIASTLYDNSYLMVGKQSSFFRFEKNSAVLYFLFLNVLIVK